MNALLGALAGIAITAGILTAVLALNPHLLPERPPAPSRGPSNPTRAPWWRLRNQREIALAALGLLVGVALAALGGWIVALVLGPVIAVGLPRLLTYHKGVDPDQLEALEEWVRSLAGVLQAEAALATAIIATLPSAPEKIRPAVENLVTRLQARRPLVSSLYAFADDVNSQTGDYVAGALIQASTVSGAGLTRTLSAIASEVANEVRVRRSVEVEREKAVNQARWITCITVVGTAVFVVATDFGAAYRTPLGQVILVGLTLGYAGALLWLRQRATTKPASRFLTTPAAAGALT